MRSSVPSIFVDSRQITSARSKNHENNPKTLHLKTLKNLNPNLKPLSEFPGICHGHNTHSIVGEARDDLWERCKL